MSKLETYAFIPDELLYAYYPVGSYHTCDPPVTDTDIDFVICSNPDRFEDLVVNLEKQGYRQSNLDEEEYELNGEGFYCCRKGNINLIVTENKEFFQKWVEGTQLAKKMNLLKKEDRVTLFQYVLYGVV